MQTFMLSLFFGMACTSLLGGHPAGFLVGILAAVYFAEDNDLQIFAAAIPLIVGGSTLIAQKVYGLTAIPGAELLAVTCLIFSIGVLTSQFVSIKRAGGFKAYDFDAKPVPIKIC